MENFGEKWSQNWNRRIYNVWKNKNWQQRKHLTKTEHVKKLRNQTQCKWFTTKNNTSFFDPSVSWHKEKWPPPFIVGLELFSYFCDHLFCIGVNNFQRHFEKNTHLWTAIQHIISQVNYVVRKYGRARVKNSDLVIFLFCDSLKLCSTDVQDCICTQQAHLNSLGVTSVLHWILIFTNLFQQKLGFTKVLACRESMFQAIPRWKNVTQLASKFCWYCFGSCQQNNRFFENRQSFKKIVKQIFRLDVAAWKWNLEDYIRFPNFWPNIRGTRAVFIFLWSLVLHWI